MDEHEQHVLHTEPSFAIYSNEDDKFGHGDSTNEDLIITATASNKEAIKLERSATIGETIDPEFTFGKNSMGMIQEDFDEEEINDDMIRGNPSSPLALRSYAQYLLESKGDISGADDYYSRAILADPEDGETLSQYATFVWEARGDRIKASSYFKRAAEAAPDDSDILAAYANFLWNIDEDDEEEEEEGGDTHNVKVDENSIAMNLPENDLKEERPASPPLHLAWGLGIEPTNVRSNEWEYNQMILQTDTGVDAEEQHRRMAEENPCNPFFLRNYAKFLHQSKGDLSGAEEYYSRAILADPSNGQTYSLYADVVWQLHRDKDRAGGYFKQAIQATPEDSNVLAAYAKFLWEAEAESDTDAINKPDIPVHAVQEPTTVLR